MVLRSTREGQPRLVSVRLTCGAIEGAKWRAKAEAETFPNALLPPMPTSIARTYSFPGIITTTLVAIVKTSSAFYSASRDDRHFSRIFALCVTPEATVAPQN